MQEDREKRQGLDAGTRTAARIAGGLLVERGAEMAAARGGPTANSFSLLVELPVPTAPGGQASGFKESDPGNLNVSDVRRRTESYSKRFPSKTPIK